MKTDLFTFNDYKAYLSQRIQADGAVVRGLRLKMSDFIGCQPSYLSQVVNCDGKPHFTLEQAQSVNEFFHHSKLESRYFLLLVDFARAGTEALRDIFIEQITEMQKSRFSFKRRVSNLDEVAESDRHKYYSAWFYSAIHVILSIKEFHSPIKIAQHLNLPVELVLEAISFLESSGLIINKGSRYEFTKRAIYLGQESDFIQRHHINWRSQALQSVEKNLKTDFHFSNVIAISNKDYIKIKEVLLDALENANKIIGPSKEEAIFALTMDFFAL